MLVEPFDELDDVGIPPHPCGEPLEVGQRLDGAAVGALVSDVAIHPIRIGPIGLDHDRAKPALDDEPPRHVCAMRIELVRTVAGLAEQDKLCVCDDIDRLPGIGDVIDRREGGLNRVVWCHGSAAREPQHRWSEKSRHTRGRPPRTRTACGDIRFRRLRPGVAGRCWAPQRERPPQRHAAARGERRSLPRACSSRSRAHRQRG